jgi:hypothetical protein
MMPSFTGTYMQNVQNLPFAPEDVLHAPGLQSVPQPALGHVGTGC